jgi:threonyl-tRNA synthetase
MGEGLKVEAIAAIPGDATLTLYRSGEFVDLCRGPHVANTAQVRAFKIMSIAGAYWRGDETRPQLQRVYGTAFADRKELKEHLRMLEEAKARDHRKLGKELGLFHFDPIAPASPFFTGRGAVVYNALQSYVRGLYRRTATRRSSPRRSSTWICSRPPVTTSTTRTTCSPARSTSGNSA